MTDNLPAAPRKARLAKCLFHGVAVAAVFVLAEPLVLAACTPPFPRKILGLTVFVISWCERIWSMYLRQGLNRTVRAAGRDWTATAIGYTYGLIIALAATEYLLHERHFGAWYTWGGGVFYAASVALRYWSFHVLRDQWKVDVSDTSGERRLVRQGPYRYLRHPIYLATCVETASLPVLLGAPIALVIAVFVFVPLEVARVRIEERYLRQTFGAAYARFEEDTPGWWPRLLRRR